jgi:S-adenosylmethionine synthetase
MTVRRGAALSMTIARAFVAKHIPSLQAYREEVERVRSSAMDVLGGPERLALHVNAADAADGSSVYLTVTGTSAECGDDGEVGRGNRANGIISPGRPMSLEALAGKNPVNHVGKLYNIVSRDIAADVVRACRAAYVECYLVSRIGAPIDQPALAQVRIRADHSTTHAEVALVKDIVRTHLAGLDDVTQRLLSGQVSLY